MNLRRSAVGTGLVACGVALVVSLTSSICVAAAPTGAGRAPSGGPAFKAERIDTALAELAAVANAGGRAAAASFARSRGLELRSGAVHVIVVGRDARPGSLALVRRAVRASGGTVLAAYDALTSARVPVSSLLSLARARGVLDVRRADGIGSTEAVSEGVAEMAANVWQAAGFTGAGVKLGIIDVGFQGYQALLGSDLPATVKTWGKSSAGPEGAANDTEAHGTGVAEIVHDVAPGATLYLARTADVVEWGLAARWMAAQGVRVINMSAITWGWGQTDGSGPVNDMVSQVVGQNVFWANGVGNSRLNHWMGDFMNPDEALPDWWLDYDGVAGHRYNTFRRTAGKRLSGCLWWDDSWTAAVQDFDLYLYKLDESTGTWQQVASSERKQDGTAGCTPVEIVEITTEAGYYAWSVWRYWSSRTDVDFDLWMYTPSFDQPDNPYPHYFMYERSFAQPADNASAGFMAAGAIGRAPGFTQENYSSQGPTRDGRITPEIATPSDVASTTYPEGFSGTSAASPHLAGVAAILRQAYPSYTNAQIEDLIKANAVDLGLAGPDNSFGWGRILLPVVPQDTTRPVTQAKAAGVKRLKKATLRYYVLDGGFSAGPAKVTIQVKNSKGKVVKTLGPFTKRPMCQWLSATFVCTLPKGTYKFFVKATDKAGNGAAKIGSARLKVT